MEAAFWIFLGLSISATVLMLVLLVFKSSKESTPDEHKDGDNWFT